MPIFGRRQLQVMLDELGPWLDTAKATDLLKRLENVEPDQALAAEYELAISWGISKVAALEIDREIGGRSPDIWSNDLVPGGPVVADVAALSDDPFSGEPLMRRAANIINGVASRVLKGAADHLYYEFQEESGYLPADRWSNGFSRYFRRRRVTRKFAMDEPLEAALKAWLALGPPERPLRWTSAEIDVVISWRDWVHPMGNTFSSMPSEVHDERDNPLYAVLKAKARQLRGAPEGVRRAIFIGDAGCSLLRDLRPVGRGLRTVSGQQIIRAFLADSKIDFIAVFTPKRANEYTSWHFDNPRVWYVSVFDRRSEFQPDEFAKVLSIRDALPNPYLHGYQARSWHQQGMFQPQGRGQFLPAKWSSKDKQMTARISARGLQAFIAGGLTREEFERWVVGENNIFGVQLARGRTIADVRFESSGANEDDDYVVFEFREDPAASPLSPPPGSKSG